MSINRRTFLGGAGAGVLSGFALGGEKSRLHAQQTDPTLTDPRIKITDVQPVRLRGQRGHQWFIIRVRTDQGIEGIGEGFLHGQYRAGAVDRFMALTKETAERLVGKNPLAINRFVREIKGRRTTDGLTWGTLIAMFEIAMWDIINATLPNLYLQEYSGGAPEDAWAEDLLDPPNQIENGHIEVSDRPGLGCTFQEKLLEQWRAD